MCFVLFITLFSSIQSCTIAIPQAHNSELMTVLKDMGHLFHLYSIGDFSNTRAIWLKSVCHYLCNGYVNVSEELLKLLSKVHVCTCTVYTCIHVQYIPALYQHHY